MRLKKASKRIETLLLGWPERAKTDTLIGEIQKCMQRLPSNDYLRLLLGVRSYLREGNPKKYRCISLLGGVIRWVTPIVDSEFQRLQKGVDRLLRDFAPLASDHAHQTAPRMPRLTTRRPSWKGTALGTLYILSYLGGTAAKEVAGNLSVCMPGDYDAGLAVMGSIHPPSDFHSLEQSVDRVLTGPIAPHTQQVDVNDYEPFLVMGRYSDARKIIEKTIRYMENSHKCFEPGLLEKYKATLRDLLQYRVTLSELESQRVVDAKNTLHFPQPIPWAQDIPEDNQIEPRFIFPNRFNPSVTEELIDLHNSMCDAYLDGKFKLANGNLMTLLGKIPHDDIYFNPYLSSLFIKQSFIFDRLFRHDESLRALYFASRLNPLAKDSMLDFAVVANRCERHKLAYEIAQAALQRYPCPESEDFFRLARDSLQKDHSDQKGGAIFSVHFLWKGISVLLAVLVAVAYFGNRYKQHTEEERQRKELLDRRKRSIQMLLDRLQPLFSERMIVKEDFKCLEFDASILVERLSLEDAHSGAKLPGSIEHVTHVTLTKRPTWNIIIRKVNEMYGRGVMQRKGSAVKIQLEKFEVCPSEDTISARSKQILGEVMRNSPGYHANMKPDTRERLDISLATLSSNVVSAPSKCEACREELREAVKKLEITRKFDAHEIDEIVEKPIREKGSEKLEVLYHFRRMKNNFARMDALGREVMNYALDIIILDLDRELPDNATEAHETIIGKIKEQRDLAESKASALNALCDEFNRLYRSFDTALVRMQNPSSGGHSPRLR